MSEISLPRHLWPLTSEPVEAMEAAKAIVGGRLKADPRLLAEIGGSKYMQKWTRIAAIYALGFIAGGEIAPYLRAILSDGMDDPDVRGHAAEALGNIRDRSAVPLLRDILGRNPAAPLRESCEYALEEIGA